jgi:isocitrate lyase
LSPRRWRRLLEPLGYDAVKHQRSVGASYFDTVAQLAAGGASSTLALAGSTEDEQFLSENRGFVPAAAARMK